MSADDNSDMKTERSSSRIEAIDVLRGFALFGVLIVNLDTEFRVTFFEQFAPHYATAADRLVRTFIGFLIEFKAITIFSMLFGVGLGIQAGTLAKRGPVRLLLARRLLVLLCFGLIHLLLIWNGDILTEYAIAGLVALPFILGPPKLMLVACAASLLVFLLFCFLPPALIFPGPAWMARHVLDARQAYGHDGFLALLRFRLTEVPWIGIFDVFIFPRTVGLILLGAWAWNSGLLQAGRADTRLLAKAGLTSLVLGLLLCWLDGAGLPAPLTLPAALAHIVDVLAPIVSAIGYSALTIAYFDRLPARLASLVAPVGRMAFTNYITQTIVLGLLFSGYGFGLLGRVGVIAGVGISIAIFAIQSLVSQWWLSHHYYGPLEWLWRTGMYGRRQPWAREPSVPVP